MAVLGHAASAEDGSGFGRPGDQTGREVRMEPLGADGNDWVYTYRYPDKSKAYRIAEAVRQACMNIMVGYSREIYTGWGLYYTRYGLWEAILQYGDIRKIDVPVNCDCSQLVISSVRIADVPGADKHREMVTAIEDETLRSLGFERFDYVLEEVEKGDIVWRPGHTGVIVEGYDGKPKEPEIQYRGRIKALTPVYKTARASVDNILLAHPLLGADNLVDVCEETEGFYYVRIIDKYGYVPADKLVRDDERTSPEVGDQVRFFGGTLYISAGGGKGVEVPQFEGVVRAKLAEKFTYPYYIYSKKYDGWCREEDLKRI